MARTHVSTPFVEEVWSALTWVDTQKKSFWLKKFMGEGEDSLTPIQLVNSLESKKGASVRYNLVAKLKATPRMGQARLEGYQEPIDMYQDSLSIHRFRHGVSVGNSYDEQVTTIPQRKMGKRLLSDYWAEVWDEMFFMYISGARGINPDFHFPLDFLGFPNSLTAPDAEHITYAGAAGTKVGLANTDKMTCALIRKIKTKAEMLAATSTTYTPRMEPIMIDGEKHWVMIMNPFQEYDLKSGTATGEWLDIQKAAATAEGSKKNAIFTGALGMIDNVILHSHESIIRFSDYGSGANLPAARALFLGSQAAVLSFGKIGSGWKLNWEEELYDVGEDVTINTKTIFGMKKTQFNGKDFGVIAVDTYAAPV